MKITRKKNRRGILVSQRVKSVFPKKRYVGVRKPTSIKLPVELVAKLDEYAKLSGYSRTDVIESLLVWAIDEYEKTQTSEKPQRK